MFDGVTHFAKADYRDQDKRFGIKHADRRLHMHIIGKTGTGKTTLLKNLIAQDIQNGHGLCVIDPHGDLINDLLDYVPTHRTRDVVYFNPADTDTPIGFNIMDSVEPRLRPLVGSHIISIFKNIWRDSWGPRLEYILHNAVMSLLAFERSSLLDIPRLLNDKEFRAKVVEKVNDPILKNFWLDEFEQYSGNFRQEAIAPIQNKVGAFLTSPAVRNIVGQEKGKIKTSDIMDSRRVMLCQLAKGEVGEETSALLGSLIVAKIYLSALERTKQPEHERKDFFLYIDECQNLATPIFASILSEARKYRLNLVLSNQYLDQVPIDIKKAILGNVGTLITFRLGASDAVELETEFRPEFNAVHLENMGMRQIYLKMAIDGLTSRPFSATTLAPIDKPTQSNRDNILKASQNRYGRNREVVEKLIYKRFGHKNN